MRNLNKYAKECMQELDSIGIKYGNIVAWKVNTRAHKRWGQCKAVPRGYEININADLLDERNSEDGLKNTIIHELLHSCEGCMNHGANWQAQAELVRYGLGYNIKRTSSAEEKGVTFHTEAKRNPTLGNDYVIKCTKCGKEYHRQKMSVIIQHPERYKCGCCGNKLIRVR